MTRPALETRAPRAWPPGPSVIVVDADRRIAFIDIKADYTQRTETPDILAAVDAL